MENKEQVHRDKINAFIEDKSENELDKFVFSMAFIDYLKPVKKIKRNTGETNE